MGVRSLGSGRGLTAPLASTVATAYVAIGFAVLAPTARACGLRTAYVDRPLEHGEARAPQQDPAADLNVTSLTDLADQLRTTT